MPESDKDFLFRMAGLVDSENWGTDDQLADQARIKSIANRLEDRNYQIDQYTRINNPNEYPIIYGKDHGEYMTCGMMVEKLIDGAREDGVTDEEVAEFLDRQFLFGCWANELEMRSPDLIRDLRGFIVTLLRRAA
jgi:hypothetical protein